MFMRLAERKERRRWLAVRSLPPRTADGKRSLWVRWVWVARVPPCDRALCRERIGAWLEHNGFLAYSFRTTRTGCGLMIRSGADLLRWRRAIVDACELFIGADHEGPLRTWLAG